jgi:hypothetical protein
VFGVSLTTLKVRPAFEQDDGVTTKLVFVHQLQPDCRRHPVAEPVERSLNATTFQFRYWHLASLFVGAV